MIQVQCHFQNWIGSGERARKKLVAVNAKLEGMTGTLLESFESDAGT